MEENLKQELDQICRHILDNDQLDIDDLLGQVQMMYENLVVQNYISFQSEESEEDENPSSDTLELVNMNEPESIKLETIHEEITESDPVPAVKMKAVKKGPELKLGLNDRISIIKDLFNNEQENFNRVISQLNTLESRDEAMDFINNMVEPDYNWSQSEETKERFIDLIEAHFNLH